MKKFLKHIIIFLNFFLLVIILILYKSEFNMKDLSTYDDKKWSNFIFKKNLFEKFVSNKKQINLILGSSHIRDSIIPDSLGKSWFSFCNGAQNIYNTYKFLNFYQDLVKIDTIICGINPFDFAYSFKNDNSTNNLLFHNFGKDSILFFDRKEFYYQRIQGIINEELPSFESFLDNKAPSDDNKAPSDSEILTLQGGQTNCIEGVDIDFKTKHRDISKSVSHLYFRNLKENINMKYFDNFVKLCQSLKIEVIFVIPPKSKFYQNSINKYEYHRKYIRILNKIENMGFRILNYEKFDYSKYQTHFFNDEVHLSCSASKIFSTIIRKVL